MRNYGLLAIALGSLALFSAQALEVPSDGTPVQFELPAPGGQGCSVLTDVWVNVPPGSQQMRITMQGSAGSDVDFLVRKGSDFDLSGDVIAQADYRSVGPDEREHVTITHASSPALAAGRWYILPHNCHSVGTQVSLSALASFDPKLDPPELRILWDADEQAEQTGFFDPQPYSNPNNSASTLGQARRMAFEHAMGIVEEELEASGVTSPVPILVGARFEEMEREDDTVRTLAFAGPAWWLGPGTPGLHLMDTFYPSPLGAKQAGTDFCRLFTGLDCGEPDINVTFNSDEDINWSYALESVPSTADFVSVAMHEVSHGLGFVSTFALEDGDEEEEEEHEAGEWLLDDPDIYSRHLIWANGNDAPLSELSKAGRMEAATSVHGLRWTGLAVADSPINPFTGTNQLFAMYAPAEVQPGSSVSHVNNQQPVAASELMRHRTTGASPRHLGNTPYFMLDMGWGGGQATAVPGQPIDFGMTGSWFEPATGGQGFVFDVIPAAEHFVAYWYTFADSAGGTDAQRWFIAQGDYSPGADRVQLAVRQSVGGAFDRSPPSPDLQDIGTAEVRFHSCTEATVSYNITLDGSSKSGEIPLQRLSPDVACGGAMPPVASSFAINFGLLGSWFEPDTGGQGLVFDVIPAAEHFVAYWYTFADNPGGPSAQRWFIAQEDYSSGDDRVTLTVRQSVGGAFDRSPPSPDLQDIGTAEVEFHDCASATLSYNIALDGSAKTGQIPLQRLSPDVACEALTP